jgi:hypothetical protein
VCHPFAHIFFGASGPAMECAGSECPYHLRLFGSFLCSVFVCPWLPQLAMHQVGIKSSGSRLGIQEHSSNSRRQITAFPAPKVVVCPAPA